MSYSWIIFIAFLVLGLAMVVAVAVLLVKRGLSLFRAVSAMQKQVNEELGVAMSKRQTMEWLIASIQGRVEYVSKTGPELAAALSRIGVLAKAAAEARSRLMPQKG